MIQEAFDIWNAVLSGDSWEMRQAFKQPGAWLVGGIVTILGGFIVHLFYRTVPIAERWLELSVMISSYLIIALIIFSSVILRQTISMTFSWTTTIPPFLFLVMTWFGCSYNVSKRSHLAFSELRMNLPRHLQMAVLTLDAVLWVVLSWIVIVTSTRIMLNSAANFQFVPGTNDVMQWWFLATVPLSFIFLSARAIGVWFQDFSRFNNGESLINPVAIGGE